MALLAPFRAFGETHDATIGIQTGCRVGDPESERISCPRYRRFGTSRTTFLNPRAAEFFDDWETVTHDAAAILRAEAGRDPYDRRLTDLIGELSTRSEAFRVQWAAHNVKLHRTGTKQPTNAADPGARAAQPGMRPASAASMASSPNRLRTRSSRYGALVSSLPPSMPML